MLSTYDGHTIFPAPPSHPPPLSKNYYFFAFFKYLMNKYLNLQTPGQKVQSNYALYDADESHYVAKVKTTLIAQNPSHSCKSGF